MATTDESSRGAPASQLVASNCTIRSTTTLVLPLPALARTARLRQVSRACRWLALKRRKFSVSRMPQTPPSLVRLPRRWTRIQDWNSGRNSILQGDGRIVILPNRRAPQTRITGCQVDLTIAWSGTTLQWLSRAAHQRLGKLLSGARRYNPDARL